MFGLSIVTAAVIYRFVEYPIRAKRWLSSRSKLFLGYGGGLAVTVSFLALAFATDGLPQRFPSDVVRLAAYADDRPPPLTECENAVGMKSGLQQCRLGPTGIVPTWFVYGDSHAWAAHSAFDQWLKSRGEAGLFAFMHGCIPINGVHTFGDKDACFRFNRSVNRIIEGSPNLKNIVLFSTWLEAAEGNLSTSTKVILSKTESLKLFDHYFSSTVEHLNELGRRMYIWEPVPGAKGDVPRGLARAALSGKPEKLEYSLAEYHSMYRFFFKVLAANRSRIYATFSPSQFLCGSGVCQVEIDGRPLYADNGHMSNSTAAIWSKVLATPVLDETNSVGR